MNIAATLQSDITPEGDDYTTVRRVIELITEDYRAQPGLEDIAGQLGQSPTQLQKTFTRWAGLSPKAFLQAVTLDHAKRLLRQEALPLLETSFEVGLSGPSRLHDLFVTHEAMSPGEWKARGAGLTIRYGLHPSPFGQALVMITDRGLAGLAFTDEPGGMDAFEDMSSRWPNAHYVEDSAATTPYAERIFDPKRWDPKEPLRVVLIGSDFQVRVWEALLRIPMGCAVTYSSIAEKLGQPTASRAVGAAVGRNPISFVVPCHRALGKSGALTGYHWGLTRKRAMLGWESGKA
ncbi:MAG TPA: bifunctional helix-turn-helix domain-containing protein/methylated-DNA--[protein]-cysteine S-methyltransferase [Shinella sp.]|jgi:AraC family transcriptional regulator of adaptative response/methylated-DNA-[protein]-cysteine methyltransferase|uniref:Bifunctional helix-turn-helix domain-containing protein/methylated-DNA--[protein]-cysteine S-methyltransferase n=1 Tax=Shinella lacus TaxID=2654216 RepID=A0ABT1R9I8_9HYPH|nr:MULTISPECIES: bifunctional helix-turn-helix domain-containing protein/methylated-DNA--[protein]-cysteine S-methyltransferase [Shinella]MCQ4631721.1 bifunctional helix-turn-helix domain-containing protein/methylated-DNA--[protein]-cysteine S-methyltransferase [Shinella lacus]MDX3977352.1 bifunctional helix-turn-helix domain-containing protein/methylated-DNA--[protein]-cysteine S-methyltransferase [Shinella sp.]HEV7246633.1 bifunctional helix-turn-helix domain-containing protein/methylated-DNA-